MVNNPSHRKPKDEIVNDIVQKAIADTEVGVNVLPPPVANSTQAYTDYHQRTCQRP